jgi:surface antigen
MSADRAMSGRRGRKTSAQAALVGFAVLMGVTVSAGASASAATGSGGPCDAVCAQATVHQPAQATTYSVRWKNYPYAHQTNADAIDRWGNVERQCTGYVTWALNSMGIDFGMRDQAVNGKTVTFLSARSWATTAQQGGWKVSNKPVVGAVAQWRAHEASTWQTSRGPATFTAGGDGHVGIVTRVYADGTVLIDQYNVGDPDRSYSTMRAKAPRYLYIGVK